MLRQSASRYRTQVFALMAVYIAAVFFLYPYAKHAENIGTKVVFAILPTFPVIAVLWVMAARIINSDELEQRVHLIALSVATGVVSALSLIGGFLSAAHAVDFDGDILIWIFPAICLLYGITRLLVGRRYGGVSCD
jgi:hypothetical protein